MDLRVEGCGREAIRDWRKWKRKAEEERDRERLEGRQGGRWKRRLGSSYGRRDFDVGAVRRGW